MDETEADIERLDIEPEHDLKEELVRFSKERSAKIAVVFNATGLLGKVRLRVLGTEKRLNLAGPIELLHASRVIKKEKSEVRTNVNTDR